MDNRLIFLYRCSSVISEGVTQKGRPSRCWNTGSKLVGGSCWQIRETVNSER